MEPKKEKLIGNLPYDCWCYVSQFLKSRFDFLSLSLSVKGFHEYILSSKNSIGCSNVRFKITEKNVPKKKKDHVRCIVFSLIYGQEIGENFHFETLNKRFPFLLKLEIMFRSRTIHALGHGIKKRINKTDVTNVVEICGFRFLKRLVFDYNVDPVYNLDDNPEWVTSEYDHIVIDKCEKLEELKLDTDRYSNVKVLFLQESFPKVEKLSLCFVEANEENWIEKFPKLSEIRLVTKVENVFPKVYSPEMEVIYLGYNIDLQGSDDFEGIELNFLELQKLRKLRIKNNYSEPIQEEITVCPMSVKNLEELELFSVDLQSFINDESKVEPGHFESLKRLTLNSNFGFGGNFQISRFPVLEVLNMNSANVEVKDLKTLKKLKKERTYGFNNNSDSVTNLLSLEFLDMHCETLVRVDEETKKKIQVLFARTNKYKLEDGIFLPFKSLNKLWIGPTHDYYKTEEWKNMIFDLPSLESFCLVHVTMTIDSWKLLDLSKSKALKYLGLKSATNSSQEVSEVVVDSKLQVLDFHIFQLRIKNTKDVEYLKLEHTTFEGEIAVDLKKRFPSLRVLSIRYQIPHWKWTLENLCGHPCLRYLKIHMGSVHEENLYKIRDLKCLEVFHIKSLFNVKFELYNLPKLMKIRHSGYCDITIGEGCCSKVRIQEKYYLKGFEKFLKQYDWSSSLFEKE